METEELFDLAIGDPRARRAPAAATVRAARPARPLRRVPGVHPARSLQHREPRADRQDPDARRSGASRSTGRCSCRESRAGPRPLHRPTRRRTASPSYDVADDRGAARPGDRAWTDDLREALIDEHGEEAGHASCSSATSAPSRPATDADWVARSAVADIARIEELARHRATRSLSLYRPLEAPEGIVRCKLFSSGGVLAVRRAADVRAHGRARSPTSARTRSRPPTAEPVWIYDFGLAGATPSDLERVRDAFQDGVPRRVARRARGRRAQRAGARAPV